MKLYLLRHGIADWRDWNRPDDERPLTKTGRREIRQIGKLLRHLKIKPARILSSPLPRAWQTAEIAAEFLERELRVEDALGKGFNAAKLRKMIRGYEGDALMIVGHEPDFSAVIRTLTGGDVKLAKGGIARVDLAESAEHGRLIWLLPPKVSQ